MCDVTAFRVSPSGLDRFGALLSMAGVSPAALLAAPREFYWFTNDAGQPVGFLGLEIAGSAARLHSLVVLPGQRGRGVGTAMVEWACDYLTERGVERFCLTTTGARQFFERAGFHVVGSGGQGPLVCGLAASPVDDVDGTALAAVDLEQPLPPAGRRGADGAAAWRAGEFG